MAELSNFQKNFLASSGHVEVFTQKEFDKALTLAQAEIMAVAIETTKQAILIERDECAKLAYEITSHEGIAEAIRNRLAQR
jgi:SOS-response transcriptional repressor LexA